MISRRSTQINADFEVNPFGETRVPRLQRMLKLAARVPSDPDALAPSEQPTPLADEQFSDVQRDCQRQQPRP